MTLLCFIVTTAVLKLSPLVPGLTTPTAGLDVYPVSELVPCCFPLARDTCVGGAVGRLKILVGWLSCWGGLLGWVLAGRVGRIYWTCVMALPPGGARDEAGRNWGWSRDRGRGPLVWLCGAETAVEGSACCWEGWGWGEGVMSCTAGWAERAPPNTKLVTTPPGPTPAPTGLGDDEE